MIQRHERRTTRADSDLAERCIAARRSVAEFFDWANFNDSRVRAQWEAWATRRVHEGWSVDAVHARVKDAWIEHRRDAGRPIRCEFVTPTELRGLFDTLREVFARAADLKPCEPWWDRAGQHSHSEYWCEMLNRNRADAGLPTGPPWFTGNAVSDQFWTAEDEREVLA